MKSLLVIRHAKSSWDHVLQKDFDRPLNDRGHRDAPAMAKRLLEKKVGVDVFVSSPAVRAFTTAVYFAKAYGKKEKEIIQVPELYEAALPVFYRVVNKIDDAFATTALFSHNPGITDFANSLTGRHGIDNMPTCGIFAVTADIEHWAEFENADKKFWFFDYPKA
jgi:phosphohistidine phosphatase